MADFDPASEPLGTADPRVRDLNTRNLDRGVNSSEMKWVNRFGEEQATLRAGSIASQEVVDTASQAKQNISAQVEGLRDEVDGRLNSILIAGGRIFDSEEQGRSAVSNDQYFYAASEYPNVSKTLWQRIDANSSRFIADDPSAEFVERISIESYSASEIAAKNSGLSQEFYSAEKEKQASFSIQNEDEKSILAFDYKGIQIQPWQGEFFTQESQSDYAYCWVTKGDLVVFYALNSKGEATIGGGVNADALADQLRNTRDGQIYKSYQNVLVKPSANSFIDRPARDVITNTSIFYGMLDELVSDFPDYITKTKLGDDDFGNEIFEYRAAPAGYWTRWYPENQPEAIAKPKIVLFGCVHGGEKGAAISNYQLLREICYRWKEDERLAYLRWGVEIVLIPVVNAWGFNNGDLRNNGNDVDINRNFPYGWEQSTDPFKGPSPASEKETQIVLQVVQDNLDACAFVDRHNAGSLNSEFEPFGYWIGTERGETIELARRSCDHMMQYIRKEFSYVNQANTPITRLVDSFGGTLAKHVQLEFNKNGYTIESGTGYQNIVDQQQCALEMTLNILYQNAVMESDRRMRETTFSEQG
ncbi:MAG: M14 family metallopeptidase [Halomonas sp.]|uniref:M14 family metallopeptidase n=1 Tax=Halomonas sp. TaxID=1486246 RepID=UPI003F908A80